MEFRDQAAQARRWWWVVALCTLLFGALGAYQQLGKPAEYASKVTLYMSAGRSENVQVSQTTNLAVQQLASYSRLVGSDKLAVELKKDTGLTMPASKLANAMKASLTKDTVLMTVTTTLPNADQANTVSQQLPVTLTRTARQLGGAMANDTFKVTFTSVDGPATGKTRSMPKLIMSTLLGLLLGSALGSALALGLARLGRGLRSPRELRELTGAEVLGVLPPGHGDDPRGDAQRWDALRRLAQNIANPLTRRRVISVVGVDHDASTVSTGLASALAETGARVLLVNATGAVPGTADAASGAVDSRPTVQRLDDQDTPHTPRQWRGWRSSAQLSGFDHVVVDGGKVLGGGDLSPATAADTTVLVARQGHTDRRLVQAARQSLTAVGALEVVAVIDDVDTRQLPRHELLAGVSLADGGSARRARAGR